jgi:hypothetical protein
MSTGQQAVPCLFNAQLCVGWRRPILSNVAKESPLPPVKSTWTVEKKLKGWDAAQTKFFKVSQPDGTVVLPLADKHALRTCCVCCLSEEAGITNREQTGCCLVHRTRASWTRFSAGWARSGCSSVLKRRSGSPGSNGRDAWCPAACKAAADSILFASSAESLASRLCKTCGCPLTYLLYNSIPLTTS